MSQAEALAAADRGQIRLARQLSRKARELAIGVGQPERAAGYESAFAVDEALFGYPREAIRAATEALRMSRGRDVEYTAALAFGLAGDVKQADVLRKDLHDRFPEDTAVNRIYLPVLSAVLAMDKGDAHGSGGGLAGHDCWRNGHGRRRFSDAGKRAFAIHSRRSIVPRRTGYRRGSQSFRRLWIILESGSLIRLARSLICRYREAIGSRATKSRHEGRTRRS